MDYDDSKDSKDSKGFRLFSDYMDYGDSSDYMDFDDSKDSEGFRLFSDYMDFDDSKDSMDYAGYDFEEREDSYELVIREKIEELRGSLSEIELDQLERNMRKRRRHKPLALILHAIGGFWAPFLYLRRPVHGIICLIGYLTFASIGWMVHGCYFGLIVIAWLLGFFYFSLKVDSHNEEAPQAVIDEYLKMRREYVEDA